jgi:sec-independent protein translocase protein TatA
MDVGPVELLIVLAVVLLLFGSKKLPELAKGMGQAAKEFRSGLHDEADPKSEAEETKALEATAVETQAVETKTDQPDAVDAPPAVAKPDEAA